MKKRILCSAVLLAIVLLVLGAVWWKTPQTFDQYLDGGDPSAIATIRVELYWKDKNSTDSFFCLTPEDPAFSALMTLLQQTRYERPWPQGRAGEGARSDQSAMVASTFPYCGYLSFFPSVGAPMGQCRFDGGALIQFYDRKEQLVYPEVAQAFQQELVEILLSCTDVEENEP